MAWIESRSYTDHDYNEPNQSSQNSSFYNRLCILSKLKWMFNKISGIIKTTENFSMDLKINLQSHKLTRT